MRVGALRRRVEGSMALWLTSLVVPGRRIARETRAPWAPALGVTLATWLVANVALAGVSVTGGTKLVPFQESVGGFFDLFTSYFAPTVGVVAVGLIGVSIASRGADGDTVGMAARVGLGATATASAPKLIDLITAKGALL